MSDIGVIPSPEHQTAAELKAAAKGIRAEAAWPGEALSFAVAEWLEMEAHMVEHRGNSVEGHTFHALKVARAYLGVEAVHGQ